MRRGVLIAGLAFLYLPLALVALYSFNASRLVTVWTGFSTVWYGELLRDDHILRAAGLSVAVAVVAATLATILGTAAGMALARFGAFRGRVLFGGLIAAPLAMPEIITGLSLLLLFVALQQVLGWPGRGFITLVLAHATLGLPYATVIVQARAAAQDRAVEEAAADLGARPGRVFWSVTLPLLRPAVMAGWLLAFVMSFDDLVVASFVTGPQSTTLPMVIFSAIRLGVSPKINALATLLLAGTAVVLAVALLLARRTAARTGLSRPAAAVV
jgi:putrescine transport system permease protein